MKSTLAIWIVLLLGSSVVNGGGISADLKVADVQGTKPSKAYRYAELTIKNSTGEVIETVLLKPGDIGMTIRYDLTVPPGTIGKRFVALPATTTVQDYLISVLSATGEKIAQTSASITWPAGLISTDEFIDVSYRPFFDDVTEWTMQTRRNYLLILVIYTLFVAGTLLIGRAKLRSAALIAIILAGIFLAISLTSDKAKTISKHHYQLLLLNADGTASKDCFTVVCSLTTRRYSTMADSSAHPVWLSARDARNDDILLRSDSRTLHFTLAPGKARIIKTGLCPIDQRTVRTSEPAKGVETGSIRQEKDHYIIKSEYLSEGMVLLCNDSTWPINPDKQNHRTAKVNIGTAIQQSVFIQKLNKQGRNHLAERIFSYWRWKYQRADEYYLVKIHPCRDGVRMEVISLKNSSISGENQ